MRELSNQSDRQSWDYTDEVSILKSPDLKYEFSPAEFQMVSTSVLNFCFRANKKKDPWLFHTLKSLFFSHFNKQLPDKVKFKFSPSEAIALRKLLEAHFKNDCGNPTVEFYLALHQYTENLY